MGARGEGFTQTVENRILVRHHSPTVFSANSAVKISQN